MLRESTGGGQRESDLSLIQKPFEYSRCTIFCRQRPCFDPRCLSCQLYISYRTSPKNHNIIRFFTFQSEMAESCDLKYTCKKSRMETHTSGQVFRISRHYACRIIQHFKTKIVDPLCLYTQNTTERGAAAQNLGQAINLLSCAAVHSRHTLFLWIIQSRKYSMVGNNRTGVSRDIISRILHTRMKPRRKLIFYFIKKLRTGARLLLTFE